MPPQYREETLQDLSQSLLLEREKHAWSENANTVSVKNHNSEIGPQLKPSLTFMDNLNVNVQQMCVLIHCIVFFAAGDVGISFGTVSANVLATAYEKGHECLAEVLSTVKSHPRASFALGDVNVTVTAEADGDAKALCY